VEFAQISSLITPPPAGWPKKTLISIQKSVQYTTDTPVHATRPKAGGRNILTRSASEDSKLTTSLNAYPFGWAGSVVVRLFLPPA